MSEDWEEVYTSSCHNCGQDKANCELENKEKLGFCGNWMPISKSRNLTTHYGFDTLDDGTEILMRYSPVVCENYGSLYKGEPVITKEAFIMAYNKWIKEETDG